MKKTYKIILILCGMSILFINFSQSALSDIQLEDYELSGFVPDTYIIWNVTQATNAGLFDYYPGYIISPGDQFKVTIIGSSLIREEVCVPMEGMEGSYQCYSIMEQPCIVGSLEYYNSSTDEWIYVSQSPQSSYAYYAILMYNKTTKVIYSAEKLVEKFFFTIVPTGINMADYGNGILSKYQERSHYQMNISDFSSTDDTLNLTLDDTDSVIGYNYIKVRSDGIVSKWIYDFDGTYIAADFLTLKLPDTGASIPFGSEFLIFGGLCIIGLLIVVRKQASIKN